MDEVSNKKDEIVCVLVLSRNEEALGVLSVLKDVPHVVILAGEGRSLAEKVGSGYMCTYLPISSIPPGFKPLGPLAMLDLCKRVLAI